MLLQIKNTIINTEKITKAKFFPRFNTTDDETGLPCLVDANLEITLTSVIARSYEGYNGEYRGAASESDTLFLRGDAAESAWQVLQSLTSFICS